MQRAWGLEKIRISPFYFNSLRLFYALEALKKTRGNVLELGCGAGAFARAIKAYRRDLEIIGSDINTDLLEKAKKLDGEILFTKADAENLPFEENSLDAIVGFDVIEHLKNPTKAFTEIYRVLKERGVVHLAIPLEKSLYTIHGLALKMDINPKRKYAGHIQQFNMKEVVAMLKDAGFKRISVQFSGHLIYQLLDFSYFYTLSLLKKQPKYTVEGYRESLPFGFRKIVIAIIVGGVSFICWLESFLLGRFPGQIGHFTAVKS